MTFLEKIATFVPLLFLKIFLVISQAKHLQKFIKNNFRCSKA